MIRCDHAFLQKFIYSITRNDKANNWSHEIKSIATYIDFEHINGKENILANTLSRLQTLDLYEDNDPEKPGHEYGKCIFYFDVETVLLFKAVSVECYVIISSRVLILCMCIYYSLLYTTACLQVPLIPKLKFFVSNDK